MIIFGDCEDTLKTLDSDSVDSLVTDPPAGISFMGKSWDDDKGGRKQWIAWMTEIMTEAMRVMKPGAHGLVWAIPRTSHWTATALEDAGFEIRDVVTHLFGSGFPKSLNVGKQLCKSYACQLLKNAKLVDPKYQLIPVALPVGMTAFAVVNAQILPEGEQGSRTVTGVVVGSFDPTAMSLLESTEPIDSNTILLWNQKLDAALRGTRTSITLTELEQITGLKIWSCLRLPNMPDTIVSSDGQGTALKPASEHWILIRKPCSEKTVAANVIKWGTGAINIDASRIGSEERFNHPRRTAATAAMGSFSNCEGQGSNVTGRFPANLVLDEEAAAMLDQQSGVRPTSFREGESGSEKIGMFTKSKRMQTYPDTGGASCFFYCAKASKSDKGVDNVHPTVKSTKLMSYLITLITPPGGIVLDPFMGSGSTGVAAKNGFQFIGIEKDSNYFEIAKKRLGEF